MQRRPRAAPAITDTDPAFELAPGGRSMLQERLTTYSATVFAIAIGYWPAFYLIWGNTPGLNPVAVRAHILSADTLLLLAVHAALWVTCRVRTWAPAWLPRIDVLAHLGLGLAFGRIMSHHPSPVMSVLEGVLAVTSILSVRALLVPSSGARTVLVGALTCLGPAFQIFSKPGHFSAGWIGMRTLGPLFINWALIAVILSTVASVVLYGLRREVRQARRLGQYTLMEKLGQGGMGVVYRAQHALLRRPTAIKLLSGTSRVGTLERFEQEVQLMAALSHPNTVAVHDYGRTADGVFYYVMEHLDGIDLEGLVSVGGPQPTGRVVHLLRQVCGSLDEAHRRGLIHRDIKPANVFLCRDRSEFDTIKVLDFGLAKDTAAAAGDHSRSSAQRVLGTPLYVSPEALNNPASVDARSDLYSLGALAYYVLTGTPVFSAPSVMEVCAHHLYTPPEPPSHRLGRPVPGDLEAIVLSCLAKAPEDRPASARALERALGACVAAGDWTETQAMKWWTEYGARVEASRSPRNHSSGGAMRRSSMVLAPTRALDSV